MKTLISVYKYRSIRACADVLADLMVEILDDDVYKIVPLPTIERHIRERGFDHIGLLARKIERRSSSRVSPVLRRGNKAVQVGANEKVRKKQAESAYIVKDNIDTEANYLLLDDVWTTGSSMLAACNKLRAYGCQKISIAVLAKSG